jgi:hypothetical protein
MPDLEPIDATKQDVLILKEMKTLLAFKSQKKFM